MPRLAAACGPTAVARTIAYGLAPLLYVRLLAVTPAVPTCEDVFDAFVCFELAGLGGPVCGEGAAVHVLEFTGFSGFAGQGWCSCHN